MADKSKMKCNVPRREVQGGKKFVVKGCEGGKEKLIRFGDANMTIKKNNPLERKATAQEAPGSRELKVNYPLTTGAAGLGTAKYYGANNS
jgi:hypothetical protein